MGEKENVRCFCSVETAARGHTAVRESTLERESLFVYRASFIERNNSRSLGLGLLAPPSGDKRLCTSFRPVGIILWTLRNIQIKRQEETPVPRSS